MRKRDPADDIVWAPVGSVAEEIPTANAQDASPEQIVRENETVAAIVASGLFDQPYYLAESNDVRTSGLDPVLHFVRHGCDEGRCPNPWFDVAFYLDHYTDVSGADINPLVHYARHGEREGRRPHRFFDPAWYAAAFDVPDGVSPLRHFLDRRFIPPHAPCADLYALTWSDEYAHDIALRIDPFLRAIDDADQTGRDPSRDLEIVARSGLLDANYYLINGSDVHESELDAVTHYCWYGWREDRNPNVYFNTRWYIATNAEVRQRRINPLLHYITVGEKAGRRPVVYFDPVWYRETYEVAPEISPLAHFVANRRSQKFSPNAAFDVAWYMAQYGHLVGPNRDPFAHFLQSATYRDLDPSASFSSAEYRRQHLGRPSRHFQDRAHPDRDNPLVHSLHASYV